MVTCYIIWCGKNDENEVGGQRVMIEMIISENDDNDGRPLKPYPTQKEIMYSIRYGTCHYMQGLPASGQKLQ